MHCFASVCKCSQLNCTKCLQNWCRKSVSDSSAWHKCKSQDGFTTNIRLHFCVLTVDNIRDLILNIFIFSATGDPSTPAMKGWPILFHQTHSENISLSLDRRRAKRIESFCKGISFTNRPIAIMERVYVKWVYMHIYLTVLSFETDRWTENCYCMRYYKLTPRNILPGLSKRADGGIVTVNRGQCHRLLAGNVRRNQELPARN